jgi:hypothetical protein
MPRIKPLPSLEGVDLAELQIAILTILDANHCGPEFRRLMHAQLGDCLDLAGGPRQVLTQALEAIRRGR